MLSLQEKKALRHGITNAESLVFQLANVSSQSLAHDVLHRQLHPMKSHAR